MGNQESISSHDRKRQQHTNEQECGLRVGCDCVQRSVSVKERTVQWTRAPHDQTKAK